MGKHGKEKIKKKSHTKSSKSMGKSKGDKDMNFFGSIASDKLPHSTSNVKSKPKFKSSPFSSSTSGLSAMQAKFAKKLDGARFRIINERLYTCSGSDALKEFSQDPSLFDIYHSGFRAQVTDWPVNPLDLAVDFIQRRFPNEVVADMGCGDAMLARRVRNKVHSFDLVSRDSIVTACDMAQVPLKNNEVGVVVYCLALMGENIGDFMREAHRILKPGGVVWLAEVRSRFEGEDKGIKRFCSFLRSVGFDVTAQDTKGNKMFFTLVLKKSTRNPDSDAAFTAKPCIYKRR
jgi:ribosomal RNA-processing protein 8